MQAMAEARALDEKIARKEEIGPLAGLPLGVKDLEDAAGLPTTHGSVPFKNLMPKQDSVQVARLKAAGAIVIGKTNAPEFGYTAHHQESAVRPDAQSMEPRAHAGRIVGRKFGGDRRGRGAARDRLRWRRLDTNSRMLRRMLRTEAIIRPHPDGSRARDAAMERYLGSRRADAHRSRHRDLHGRRDGLSSGRSRLVAASGNLICRDARSAAEKIAHRVSSRLRTYRAARREPRSGKSRRRVQGHGA